MTLLFFSKERAIQTKRSIIAGVQQRRHQITEAEVGRPQILMLVALLLTGLGGRSPVQPTWVPIAEGVEAAKVDQSGGLSFALMRVDLAKASLAVRDIRDKQGKHRAVADLVVNEAPIAAINGGFFDIDGSPMGLLVMDGVKKQKLRKVDWGVFYIDGDGAHIVHTTEFVDSTGIQQALQSGPRLVVDGEPVKLKPQSSRRSALGIDHQGRLLLLTTSSSVEARRLANVMRDLGCVQALNLDGGPSAQLAMSSPSMNLNISGGAPVPIAIVVESVLLPPSPAPSNKTPAKKPRSGRGCR